MDAAVGTAFALAVTFPQAGNIGGGGFIVSHFPRDREAAQRAFDFRERAPLMAHEKMFFDAQGKYSSKLHHHSHLSVGVPGSVAGLHLAHSKLGKLPWEAVVAPAIQLAEEGFVVSERLEKSLALVYSQIQPKEARDQYFAIGGRPLKKGDRWIQKDLARCLKRIAQKGPKGFYQGETADHLIREMQRGGGWISQADLDQYEAQERTPLKGTYRGYEVFSMPPVSSGGVALLQMLNLLEQFPLKELGLGTTESYHVQAEAMRRAFADRARYLGDPDFVEVPVADLINKNYARNLRRTISTKKASKSSPKSFEWPYESDETTHLSVIDKDGNGVSLTTTLEFSWGARIVVPGAGFLLNNEMGDFNPVPGDTNSKGRIGTKPNLVRPKKRMVSSMTPTLLLKDGELFMVLGSPGGRTIINSVLEVILNVIDYEQSLQDAVDQARIHHQWLPDTLWVESAIPKKIQKELGDRGHSVKVRSGLQGSIMALRRHVYRENLEEKTHKIEVGQDTRRGGASAGH